MEDPDAKHALRVLAVDDEPFIARLIQVTMQRRGHTVTMAYNGMQAVEWLERESFDVAVLDHVMPYISGFGVLEWIRTHEATRDMKVVLMVDKAEEWIDRPDLEFRADQYITKPFTPVELLPSI